MTNALPLPVPLASPVGGSLKPETSEQSAPRASLVRLEPKAARNRRSPIDIHGPAQQPDSLFFALARSIEERDPSLGSHCERLALMASAIGHLLNLSAEDIATLNCGGYLHDIGKIALPDTILLKPGPLDQQEWELMKTHPARGEQICKSVSSLQPVLPIIRQHHEHWDGSGYPDRLRGDEISLLARILQMADIYDALTSQRPYKNAFSPEESLKIIREETCKGWRDPSLLPVLEAAIPLFSSESFWDASPLSLGALAASLQKHELPKPAREAIIR